MERQIQVRTMSGREPTPEQRAYLSMVAPEKEERSERLAAARRRAQHDPASDAGWFSHRRRGAGSDVG